jgi:hypothetical protein
MKSAKFSGTMESAYGNKLDTPIKFEGTFEAFENYQEIVAAKEELSNDELVKAINDKRKANARQKAMTAALDAAGIKKPVVDATPEGMLVAARNLVKDLIASGRSEADAKQTASTIYGVSLA